MPESLEDFLLEGEFWMFLEEDFREGGGVGESSESEEDVINYSF